MFIKKDPYIPQVKNKTSIQFRLLPYNNCLQHIQQLKMFYNNTKSVT